MDIKPFLLGPESTTYVPERKILINEMLPRKQFELFRDLKPIAQSLGYKCVWHVGGRFMTRRRGSKRTYTFTSAAKLHNRSFGQPNTNKFSENEKSIFILFSNYS